MLPPQPLIKGHPLKEKSANWSSKGIFCKYFLRSSLSSNAEIVKVVLTDGWFPARCLWSKQLCLHLICDVYLLWCS